MDLGQIAAGRLPTNIRGLLAMRNKRNLGLKRPIVCQNCAKGAGDETN
jgi:hypothetical protein